MTLKEIRKKKENLKKQIQEVRTEGDLEELKSQIEELQIKEKEILDKLEELEVGTEEKADEEQTEEDETETEKEDEEPLDERSLTRNQKNIEKRKAEGMKIIKRKDESPMEEKNILETKEYRSAFLKRLQGKKLNEEEERAMTTAEESVGSAIPTTTLNKIEEKLRQTSALFNEVEVLNIPGYLSIPKEDVTNDASWVEEDSASTDVNDTLDAISFGAFKLIRTISITAEVEAMSIDAFESYIVKKLSDKLAIAIENAILNGDGTGKMKGILAETEIEKVTYANGSAPTYANLCKLMAKLKAGYKPNAKFVMSAKMLWENIATITVGDKLVFLPDPTGEFAGRIFGRPVIEDDYISDKKILFGNFTKYTINFNKPIEIKADESAEFRKGNKVYRGMGLIDGKTVNKEAFVILDEAEATETNDEGNGETPSV